MTEGQLALIIPIITVTLSMAVAIIFILARHRKSALELEHRHKERMAAIDRGLDIPVEPVKLVEPRRPPYLLRGLVWLGIGVAVVFGLAPLLDEHANTLGWIPLAIGIAYLIYYVVEGRNASKDVARPSSSTTESGSAP